MAYDGTLLARAREKLEKIRSDNQSEHARRVSTVYGRSPEIVSLEARMRSQMAELVRLTASRPADLKQRLEALREENLSCQMRRTELLVEHGYEENYLDEIYSCPDCRDTGVYNGGVCRCLKKLYNAELTKELSALLQSGNESFDSFDLMLYDASPLPGSTVSPRETMTHVFDAARRYADGFSRGSKNLLMQGGTGLGKTYLSACIARAVAEKGFSVCYDSAASALDAFETRKFSRDSEAGIEADKRVKRMLGCDLMILDDLGTEMNSPVSVSALYSLINTRLVNALPTIISTNLSDEGIDRRYTPQISSRIHGEYLRLPFVGSDIRRKK